MKRTESAAPKARKASASAVPDKGAAKAEPVARRKAAAQGKPLAQRAATVASAKRTRAVSKPGAPVPAQADSQQIAHGLNTLLHTMQVIQQHEETLCSLMHAIRRGRISSAALRELRAALAELPAHDYLHEIEQLQELAG